MNLQAVILDMDGLMLDTEPLYKRAWQRAARHVGFEISDELCTSFSGKSDRDSEEALLQELGPGFPLSRFQALWPNLWHREAHTHGVQPRAGFPASSRSSRSIGCPPLSQPPAHRHEPSWRSERLVSPITFRLS